MPPTATPPKPKAEPTLFSTRFDAAGHQKIKLSKPVLTSILKTQGYLPLLAVGCPALSKAALAYEAAGKALLSEIGALGGLEGVAADEG